MAADTDGQWIQAYLVFRECRLQSCLPAFSRLLIPGVGSPGYGTVRWSDLKSGLEDQFFGFQSL